MGLGDWEKEFYPKDPKESMTWLEAAEHSLRKWRGALQENLERFGGRKVMGEGLIFSNDSCSDDLESSDDFFDLDADSCALCVRAGPGPNCEICPVKKLSGKSCADERSAYDTAITGPSVMPMVRLLRRVVRHEKKKRDIRIRRRAVKKKGSAG